MKYPILILFIVSTFFSSSLLAKEFTFGIVPQQSSKKLARLWSPVLKMLSEESGHTLKFATAKDIPTFEARLAAGEYDFAYMNPYHFVVFNQAPGYVAMAHQSNKRIKGIVVVRKDSVASELSDLDGQTLAFPSPAAFAATILPTANIKKQKIEIDSKYVSSHDSVYLAVSKGLLSAGGGIIRTFENADPAVRDSLRVLWKSDGYTPHAFAAHPSVTDEDRESLASALATMQESERGLEILSSLNFGGIQRAQDDDWDDVRGLEITTLDEE